MDRNILAIVFQEGGKLITELVRNRPPKQMKVVEHRLAMVVEEPEEPFETAAKEEEKASSIEAGCVPCAIGHFGTCTGLLNESMRFARSKGIDTNEVIDRISHCLQELNALEREDLTSENIINLPPWEKEIAIEALDASRATRHLLEGITTADDLEKATAKTQTANTQINRKWFKKRLAKMPKEEKTELVEKAIEKLGEEE